MKGPPLPLSSEKNATSSVEKSKSAGRRWYALCAPLLRLTTYTPFAPVLYASHCPVRLSPEVAGPTWDSRRDIDLKFDTQFCRPPFASSLQVNQSPSEMA